MLELTPQQVAALERLAAQGFQVLAFPLYANAVGIRNDAARRQEEPAAKAGAPRAEAATQ